MAALLQHRGPDDHGSLVNDRIGLAHQRLSILDSSEAARQPMSSGGMHLVVNGEIYNHRALASAHSLNASLRSRSDSEVLLKLAEAIGVESTLNEIDGMYAFALWNASDEHLHLVRDPMGIKPMFVLNEGHTLWFASEIKPLLLVPGFERRPSTEALHHYLSFDYIPGHHTAFEGIEEVRPGAWWTVDANTGQITKQAHSTTDWTTDPSITQADAVARVDELLLGAVERQLVADVEVGVMLSGGLDSSSLAALTKEVRGDAEFHTFSIGFDDSSFNEANHAQIVAGHLGTRHHQIDVHPEDIAELLPLSVCSIDEPYADGSAMPTAMLARVAREHVTVLLSGEGGDEMFSGYDTHAAAVARSRYRWVPGWLRRGLIQPMVNLLPVRHSKLSFDFKAKRFAHGAEFEAARAHFAWREVLSEDAKREILKTDEPFPPSHHLFDAAWDQCQSGSELHKMLHTDRSFHLPDDLMVKNDRMTMAHSLEARVPFCDSALVAFLATVPPRHLMNGMTPKVLLKRAMKNRLPSSIINRKKMGLEMPYSSWMRGPLRSMTETILESDRVGATGILQPEPIMRLLTEHMSMKVDNGRALWGLINLVLWHEAYIQSDSFLVTTLAGPLH
jgi:asparagine synthase (glutamine-hydrolysing)